VYLGALDNPDARFLLAADAAAVFATSGHLLTIRQGILLAFPFNADRGTLTGDAVRVADGVGLDRARGAFSVSSTGVIAERTVGLIHRQLVWFDRKGVNVGSVGSPEDYVSADPELSPEGSRVALVRIVDTNEIWLLDAGRGVRSRFTFNGGNWPVMSHDGTRVAFGAFGRGVGPSAILEKGIKPDTDERVILAPGQSFRAPIDYSPDGRILLYVEQSKATGADIWAVPLDGTAKPFPVVQSPTDQDEAQFSPDGRWIAYRSMESGRPEIFLQRFPAGAKQQVSLGGGDQPRWRRDGRELFYVASDTRLMAVPITQSANGGLELGAATPLFPTRLASLDQRHAQYAVSADGQRFLLNVFTDVTASPISIVLNWFKELR